MSARNQPLVAGASVTATGVALTVSTLDYQAVSVQIAGTFTATLSWEASNDNTTWVAVPLTNITSAASAATATTAGIYAGSIRAHYFRVNCTAFTSGPAVLNLCALE